jgi:hypothetical protein
MEQAPADARAAPIAAGPANMDTTESLSPKRPRESASGKMVSQRATQIKIIQENLRTRAVRMKLPAKEPPAQARALHTSSYGWSSQV